jgi:acetyl-CoA acetyltransferase
MSKQIQDAYIVAATRLPVGRRKGMLGHVRPDDMLAHAIRSVMAQAPGLDPALVEDVIVGCAMPEAEQGMNVARIGLLLAGLPNTVPGVTVNRFCASGLQTVAMAADRIRLGEADVMIAGGTETMSLMNQIMGNKIAINPAIFEKSKRITRSVSGWESPPRRSPRSGRSRVRTRTPSPSPRTGKPVRRSPPVTSRPRYTPYPVSGTRPGPAQR